MALRKCADIRGNATLVNHRPMLETYRDVLYVPFDTPDASPGIFDHGRKLITASGYFRSAPFPVPLEQYYTKLNPARYETAPDDVTYVFMGHITAHYGHFLFASLGRLWALDELPRAGLKLVVLNSGPLDALLATPFIQAILTALSIGPGDIVNFAAPTRIDTLIVPSPAIEEQNFSHRAFAEQLNRVGDILTADRPLVLDDTPIFLSKMKLGSGIYRIANEDEFCARLEHAGVRMVFPETLPLADQVMLFRNHTIITGIAGSALHTAIFSPPRPMLTLNPENLYLTNQVVLDLANGGSTLCLYAHGDMQRIGDTPHFHHTLRLTDPHRTADQFLLALDRLRASNAARTTPRQGEAGQAVNLALRRPTRQSSQWTDPDGPPTPPLSHEAVNGLLTGRFQFHTESEASPWWDVDLGEVADLHELKLFNRTDVCPERANRLAILLSLDGTEWTEAARCELDTPFGGLDGNPLVLPMPPGAKGRFARVQLLGQDFLHLDQVEVYGTRTAP